MAIMMMNDEVMKALKCHAAYNNSCSECPFEGNYNCSMILARAVLDALNTKDESNTKDKPLDKRQMVLEAIRMALDKGYNVIITPTTCEIRLMP